MKTKIWPYLLKINVFQYECVIKPFKIYSQDFKKIKRKLIDTIVEIVCKFFQSIGNNQSNGFYMELIYFSFFSFTISFLFFCCFLFHFSLLYFFVCISCLSVFPSLLFVICFFLIIFSSLSFLSFISYFLTIFLINLLSFSHSILNLSLPFFFYLLYSFLIFFLISLFSWSSFFCFSHLINSIFLCPSHLFLDGYRSVIIVYTIPQSIENL